MGADACTLADLDRDAWPTVGDYLWIHEQGTVIVTCAQDHDGGVHYEGLRCVGPTGDGTAWAQNCPHDWWTVSGQIGPDTVFRILPSAEWPRLPWPGDRVAVDLERPSRWLRVDLAGETVTPGVWQAFGELLTPDGASLGDDLVQLLLRTRAG